MKSFTVEEAVRAVGGEYRGDAKFLKTVVTNVTSDSRTVGKGSLFVAIRGERSDGHDYIAPSLAAGAALCISCREPKDESETPCVVVGDSVRAVGDLAAWYRTRFQIPVVGVTGSVGKTTTKEMIYAVLSQKFRTHKTQKNFNNELGVPQTLLAMPEDAQAAVIEMGISHFGEMERLADIVRPTIAVIGIIGYSHLEFLHDRAGVLRAKGEIVRNMGSDGLLIVNGDDDLLRDFSPVRRVVYGTEKGFDFVAENIQNLGQDGVSCSISWREHSIDVVIPAYGTHMVYAALAAAAVGDALGLSPDEIRRGIESYETVGRRARIVKTDDLTIVDDCYNANPSSVGAAIDSLCGAAGRRVVILGDMLELGENTKALHAGVGKKCAEAGVDLVLTCGELSRQIDRAARENGANAQWFESRAALIAALPALLQKGDTVLVKASHSCKFDEITDDLSARKF